MADPANIPFGEWTPDRSTRANPACEASGVVSLAGQYAPFRDIVDYNGASAATAALCNGAATFYDSTTTPHIYLADASKLYHLEVRVATDRSLAGGYTVPDPETWNFAQYGNIVIAVADSEQPQFHTMTSPTVAFANLSGAPVNATSVARVNDFVMMGKGFTIYASAFNDPSDWTPAEATQCISPQALDQEQGIIQQIIGLDYAAVFQERAIRRVSYVGPPIVWDFGQDAVEKARGSISRNAADAWGRNIFYVADDGMYVFDGQSSQPIGEGKVDDYFVRQLNYPYRHRVCAACVNKRFYVGFPAGSSTTISEVLIFSMQDGRWTHDDAINLDWLFRTPSEPLTVDNFHTLYTADNLDATNIVPDNIDSTAWDDRRRQLAGVQTNHHLGLFTGTPRQAVVETPEVEPAPGRRALVTEIWPLGDAPQTSISCSVGYRRALPSETVLYTNPTAVNRAGYAPQKIDARFLRGRKLVAAGAAWTRLEGLHYTAMPTGKR